MTSNHEKITAAIGNAFMAAIEAKKSESAFLAAREDFRSDAPSMAWHELDQFRMVAALDEELWIQAAAEAMRLLDGEDEAKRALRIGLLAAFEAA
jgi:hypothetical protein